jgi:hypothetical protein
LAEIDPRLREEDAWGNLWSIYTILYFSLLPTFLLMEKVLQPVLSPTCGSQPPMLNQECRQNIIEADGKKYANNTNIFYADMK